MVRDASALRVFLADRDALGPLLATLVASEARVSGVTARDLTLEEIFLEVTGAAGGAGAAIEAAGYEPSIEDPGGEARRVDGQPL